MPGNCHITICLLALGSVPNWDRIEGGGMNISAIGDDGYGLNMSCYPSLQLHESCT